MIICPITEYDTPDNLKNFCKFVRLGRKINNWSAIGITIFVILSASYLAYLAVKKRKTDFERISELALIIIVFPIVLSSPLLVAWWYATNKIDILAFSMPFIAGGCLISLIISKFVQRRRQNVIGGSGGIGPAWTYDKRCRKPAGQTTSASGTFKQNCYTPEQIQTLNEAEKKGLCGELNVCENYDGRKYSACNMHAMHYVPNKRRPVC